MEKEKKNEKPKDMATALDCAIRGNQIGGYEVGNVRYYNYMSNHDWELYFEKMKPNHKKQYGTGAGGELKAGKYPPKMASFGSSSRFIYELSRDAVEDFIFEERLDTRVGGTANLDGFLRRKNKYIYVEAKRREIYYPSHEKQEIKSVYVPVYNKIKSLCKMFNYEPECGAPENGEELKKITFYVNNEPVKFFDLKQLICHFLGITYDIAKHPVKNVKVKFLYLLYNPKEIEEKIDGKYCRNVMKRYDEVVKFIDNNTETFESIFKAVLQYQTETHKLELPDIEFKFKLVNQSNYISELQIK